ncbi:MAG TPA: hypothetical protein VJ746_15725 [Nitrospira sp.]|nr:hypothetical protein [Nitrospira sp.]
MGTENRLTILDVNGPFREPREPVFSYDYAVQRSNWPMPHAVLVKVSIADELDVVRSKLLGPVAGTPGRQLLIGKVLSRKIADEKLRIAEAEGWLSERRDLMVPPFTGPYQHLFPKLEEWMSRGGESLRMEVNKLAGL